MEDQKEKIKKLIQETIEILVAKEELQPTKIIPEIDTPKDLAHGDLTTNVAFKLAKENRKSPRDIAFFIATTSGTLLNHPKYVSIQKIQPEGAGFINFYLSQDSRGSILKKIQSENEQFGFSNEGKGAKVNIEFVSANPTGPLTIAHGRQAAVGDTLANILNAAGYQVSREFYLNDAGKQILCLGESVLVRVRELNGEKVSMPENGYYGNYVIDLAKKIKETGDILKASEFAAGEMLEAIKNDLKDLGVLFDTYYSEKSLYEKKLVDQILEKLKSRGLLYESEGALWFKSTEFGDDKDRVLKKSDGEFTYFTADIAYHEDKFKRGFDRVVNLWGPDHHGYIPRVKAACQALGYPPEKISILIVQLTTLYRKGEQIKMSKRAGEYVTLRELIDEVGADATRFFFLMRRVESHLDFDLELAKEKSQDNPVYYLQYAHARICSILAAASTKIDSNTDTVCLTANEEIELFKKLSDFSEAIKQAAFFLEPHRLVEYLRDLAASFHKFYAVCRVIGDDLKLTRARLLLTDSIRIVLRNGLKILGLSHPEKM